MVSMADPAGRKEGLARYRVRIAGTVQGVGFRPYVYQLAHHYRLGGWVRNSSRGVVMEVEGPPEAVHAFLQELAANPPRLAKIASVTRKPLPPAGYSTFEIVDSRDGCRREALVPSDVALCEDCRREVLDPEDRHYRYPFTNCTNCGPRYTVIRGLPYDRHRTSMAAFDLCPDCSREYHHPGDRRFHAQPVACPRCGPRVWLADRDGRELAGDWVEEFRRLILDGYIVALKGLGGFHLACDARRGAAVGKLRERKGRPAKPFAVMARDLDVVRRYCRLGPEEERLLESPEAPIVILERHPSPPTGADPGCARELPANVAPGLRSLGVMLPYAPLHLLLFGPEVDLLVMTSGNASELPLVKDNGAALAELGPIADYFLLHDREIVNRCDDSLVRVVGGEIHFYRRSRGYIPRPVEVPWPAAGRDLFLRDASTHNGAAPSTTGGMASFTPCVLGIGGEMKNAFCLLADGPGRRGQALMSPHVGELDSVEGLRNLEEILGNLCRFLRLEPVVVAYDRHPGYQSAALARRLPARHHVPVQHHHAHLASCLAENGLTGPAIGIVADGTGYGTDGAVWGFEVLVGDYRGFKREYHLAYLPLPGGEAAVRQPWQMAVAYLYRYLGEEGLKMAAFLFPGRERAIGVVARLVETGFNSPPTSSCGRWFDAVSAMLGVCLVNTYEGQAAAELGDLVDTGGVAPGMPGWEEAAREAANRQGSYPFSFRGKEIDPGPAVAALAGDLRGGYPREVIAARFHNTVAGMMVEAACRVREREGLERVALSGGVFQNPYLYTRVRDELTRRGFQVYGHRVVPANDGGLALGQAMVALWRGG